MSATLWSQEIADFNSQDSSVSLGDTTGLLGGKAEADGDGALQGALRRPVCLKLLKLLHGRGNVAQICLAGVVQQSPQRIFRPAKLADADAVLGHAVKVPCMPCKAALVAEGVGYILDSDVSRIRKQRPEADAREGCDRAIGTHTTQKIMPDTLGTIPHPLLFLA